MVPSSPIQFAASLTTLSQWAAPHSPPSASTAWRLHPAPSGALHAASCLQLVAWVHGLFVPPAYLLGGCCCSCRCCAVLIDHTRLPVISCLPRRTVVSLTLHLASRALWPAYTKALSPAERRQWCNKIACGLHVSGVLWSAVGRAILEISCRLQALRSTFANCTGYQVHAAATPPSPPAAGRGAVSSAGPQPAGPGAECRPAACGDGCVV